LEYIKNHPLLSLFTVAVLGILGLAANTYLKNQQQAANWGARGPTLVVTEPVRMQSLVDSIESIGTA
jgi:hypothetical protein